MKRTLAYFFFVSLISGSALAAEVCGHLTSYCFNGGSCLRFICNETQSFEIDGTSELANHDIGEYVGYEVCAQGEYDLDIQKFHVTSVRPK